MAGYTPEQLALKTGKSRGWVYQRLKLLDLCTEARKALAAGILSVSVAVPLARLPSAKLQVKALERVVGETPLGAREAIEYLQREFCVPLRGAPFDRKDDMLVEGAGSCVKCPKRSGSGVPGLFEDIESLDVCTDVVCYQAKARATWDAKAEKAAKAGAEVLTLAEGKRLFRDGTLVYGSGYVELDAPVHEDAQRRTWAEVGAKVEPQVVVAPDAELRVHRLYRETEARAAAAQAGAKWAKRAAVAVESAPAGAPEAKTGPSEEELRAVRASVARDMLVGTAVKLLSQATPPRAFYVLLAKAIEATRPPGEAVKAYLERQRVKDVSAWILRAEERELLAFAFVAVTEEWCGGTWDGFDEGLEVAAKAFGFNLSQMVQDAMAAHTAK